VKRINWGKNMADVFPNRVLRVTRRIIKNPFFEIKWQCWNVRDLIFLRKVVKGGNIYYRFRGELYPESLTGGNAAAFIEETAKLYCHGKGLDIGPGKWPLKGAISVENGNDQNAYNLDRFEDNSLDFVFSSHCLEHLKRWEDALSVWIRKLKAGGILFLYLPHESMKMWRPGGPWARHHHVWIPTVEKIHPFLKQNGMEILDYNPDKDQAWGFHIVAKKQGNC
jgi:SAM-dependent methyltransferase